MKKTNLSERHSFASLSKGSLGDVQGRIFVNEVGINDLTNVEIVGTSVDTIRQLYYGKPKLHLVENYEAHIGEYLSLILPITLKHADYNAYQPCLAFHLCRMGKVSRYRFKLQNNELGIVILFGSYFAKMENFGQHLKIELSPKFISSHTSVAIQHWLDHFGLIFLDESVAKGCAVHLACDYQGFDLPTNFLDVFQTRSRIVQQYDGLNILDLSRVSSVVSSYGHGVNKGYLLGKANALQVSLYCKSAEIIKSDKVDYFQEQWQIFTLGTLDTEKTVRRLEMRVTHTIVREIGNALGVVLESFLDVSKYLTDIWRYALKTNSLKIAEGSKLVHPFWQLLMEDVFFYNAAQNLEISRKKKDDVSSIEKNVCMLLGNLISICARDGLSSLDVKSFLQKTNVYPRILEVYRQRGLNEDDLVEFIDNGLRRRLIGKAA